MFGSVRVCVCVSVRLSVGALLFEPVPAGFFHPPHGRGPVWNVAGLASVGIHG